MFKVKAYHFNPINIVCITLLSIILFLIITGYQPVSNPIPTTSSVIHPTSITVNSAGFKRVDYALEITDDGKYVILWDGERPVSALPLDNKCNLTNAILWDNQ